METKDRYEISNAVLLQIYSAHAVVIIIIYLLRHESSTGKHKHTNIQNIQKT